MREIYPTNTGKNYWILLQIRTRYCKSCFQKIIHNTAEPTGEVIGNKTTEKVVKPKCLQSASFPEAHLRNVEEINIPPKKKVVKG